VKVVSFNKFAAIMGLTFHYSGSFNPRASLSEMIVEVKEIAETHKWKYTIFEEKFPKGGLSKKTFNDNIYGIVFTPPDCETVSLTFLSNGKMASPWGLKFWGNATYPKEKEFLYMLSVKTQYAGSTIHKLLIHLLKYLSAKYFDTFKVYDEGKYWETMDEKLLDEIFAEYTNLIDTFALALQTIPVKEGETIEKYLQKVIKRVQKVNKNKGKDKA
jgi:hypothetical protein